MAADRRVDAAGSLRQFREYRLIERLAHAVEPLELEAAGAARILDDARHGKRVVGGELRKDARACREEPLYAGHVAEVGHGLARVHRIVGKPALLRALDLGVPVGALDQAHGHAAVARGGSLLDPVDRRQGALLIGLHGEAEAVPAGERCVAKYRGDDVEGELQPVGLFGVDGELQVVVAGKPRKLREPRHELRQHALARDCLVARMQCREFHRDTRPLRQRGVAGIGADGRDGAGISVEILVGVGRGAGAFAEHVVRVAELGIAAGACERLVDGLAEHEMRAE